MIRVYLDNCMFNRPFDDQRQLRIKFETEAKLYIQDQIKNAKLELIWSYILEFENLHNPFIERKIAIQKWKKLAVVKIPETESILATAKQLLKYNIKTKDALHVASAIEGKADCFFTTDDKLLSAINRSRVIQVLNPIDYIKEH